MTPLTISNWMKQRGIRARQPSRNGADFAKNLRRLADLHESIVSVERELHGLEREYGKLKSAL